MEYSINKLAKISGVSSRTLRYYDEIGLLKPKRMTSSGYRIYGADEVDSLQKILFYKSFGIKLEEIKVLLDKSQPEITQALIDQHQQLLMKRQEIDTLLQILEKNINYYKGESNMTDQEKFDYFKEQKLQENDQLYGNEIRQKYGKDVVEQSNKKWQNLTVKQYEEMQQSEEQLIAKLNELLLTETVEFNSPAAKEAFDAHKNWLMIAAPYYSPEYHRNLADLYVNDERFSSYYNEKTTKDSAKLLQEIIYYYTA